MRLCAVIPAHNEIATIAGIVRGALASCERVIVVDDGSSDGTAEEAERAGAVVVKRSRKSGKGVALREGFSRALQYEIDAVITLDSDGQHDPADIPRFVRCAEQRGEAIVTGNRMGSARNMPRARWISNWLTSKALSIALRHEISDSQCGYRLIRTELLRKLPMKARKYDIETEILVEAHELGVHPCEIPIRSLYRHNRSTHGYPDVTRFIQTCTRYDSAWRIVPKLLLACAGEAAPLLGSTLRALSVPALALILLALFAHSGGGHLPGPEQIRSRLANVGFWAPALFVFLCTVKPLTFLPFSGLTVVAGAAFGLWEGTLWTALGGMTGAMTGFFMGRIYFRPLVQRFVLRRFPSPEIWIHDTRWSTILFVRLLNFPWDWVSYAAGLSSIRFRDFMVGTAGAVLPVAFFGVYVGDTVWSFPSPQFFLAFASFFAFGTVAYLLRRSRKRRAAAANVPAPEAAIPVR